MGLISSLWSCFLPCNFFFLFGFWQVCDDRLLKYNSNQKKKKKRLVRRGQSASGRHTNQCFVSGVRESVHSHFTVSYLVLFHSHLTWETSDFHLDVCLCIITWVRAVRPLIWSVNSKPQTTLWPELRARQAKHLEYLRLVDFQHQIQYIYNIYMMVSSFSWAVMFLFLRHTKKIHHSGLCRKLENDTTHDAHKVLQCADLYFHICAAWQGALLPAKHLMPTGWNRSFAGNEPSKM